MKFLDCSKKTLTVAYSVRKVPTVSKSRVLIAKRHPRKSIFAKVRHVDVTNYLVQIGIFPPFCSPEIGYMRDKLIFFSGRHRITRVCVYLLFF